MERAAYDLLRTMEDSWWYRGRSYAVMRALEAARVSLPVATLLDYGAGFGGMVATGKRFAKDVDAYEPHAAAAAILHGRGYRRVLHDEATALSHPYDMIGLFDVLEHIEDDHGFLARAYNSLPSGGYMVVAVPAYSWLWSEHDVVHKHFRRYRKRALSRLFTEAGFTIPYATYWNMTLLLPVALLRLLGMSGEGGLSPTPIVNRLLTTLVYLESKILRHIPLPFGVSIVLVAQKP